MSRTNLYRMLVLLLVLVVLSFGEPAGVSISPGGPGRNDMRGVALAQSDNKTMYLPLISRRTPLVASTRTVNAPYFSAEPQESTAAVFWFGRVTEAENYADVRVGYTSGELILWFSAFDRRIWGNPDDTPNALNTLTDWDGMALYLNPSAGDARKPSAESYRIIVQWNTTPENHAAAFRGNGQNWQAVALPFTYETGWRGNSPNDDIDDDGWRVILHIPFSSLGFSHPPAQGAGWGMAVDMYDRDSAGGPPNPVKTWPESPGVAGRLAFGVPVYQSPAARSPQSVMVRQGLNGANVKDGMVGGSSICGDGLDRWTQWGSANYAGSEFFVVQNQADVADFPCFSKEYLVFPLSAIPPGKVIVSARLTIHQFGNSEPSQALDSFIQVMRVQEDWDPSTLNWNNAPLALENYTGTWVPPIRDFSTVPWPGIPYQFDVSRAVADAYQEGQPLRLALYDADTAMHSGKYFVSSFTGDWNAAGRPALEVTWGEP